MEVFSFQNKPKNLDPSYKKDRSRFLGLLKKDRTRITAQFHGTDLVIFCHSREENPVL